MKPSYYQEMREVENEHWWFVARRNYIQALLLRILANKKNLRICEIGCGTGGNLEMLSTFGQLDAVEMNDYAKSLAKQRKIPNVDCILSGYLPDQINLAGEYDAVFALDVIEHVKHDDKAVDALSKILKNDGIIIATVPAYQWLWSRHDEVNMHYRRYTKKEFIRLFEDNGLNVTYASYFNTLLFPIAAITRFVESVFNRRKKTRSTDITLPPPSLNRFLKFTFNIEKIWSGRFSIPFGLSVIVIAESKK